MGYTVVPTNESQGVTSELRYQWVNLFGCWFEEVTLKHVKMKMHELRFSIPLFSTRKLVDLLDLRSCRAEVTDLRTSGASGPRRTCLKSGQGFKTLQVQDET